MQNKDARCEIQQDAAPGNVATPGGAPVSFASILDVPDATARVSVNGVLTASQSRGRVQAVGESRARAGRIEGSIQSASGKPGTWRFELAGSFEAGSLRVLAGDVALLTPDVVVFRLSGRAGERVIFTFSAGSPR
jgi:hypothetical protein